VIQEEEQSKEKKRDKNYMRIGIEVECKKE